MNDDAKKLASVADQRLCLKNAILSNAYYYQSLPFCIVDAIFSLGVKYAQVENVVCRFAKVTGWQLFRHHSTPFPSAAEQKTVSEFLDFLFDSGTPAQEIFGNFCYANPRAKKPMLKANLVVQFAKILNDIGIQTFQDLAKCQQPDEIDKKLCDLPALKSGVAVSYFRMLAGSDNHVKADRMIRGFVRDVLGRTVTNVEAASIIRDSCEILKSVYPSLTPRLLDHEIWKYQRGL